MNLIGFDGAAEWTRTPDPIITNDVLYHLSYSGIWLGCDHQEVGRAAGVIFRLGVRTVNFENCVVRPSG